MADKQRLAIIIGAGFSTAMTSGKTPILGNSPLPTLNDLSTELLNYMRQLESTKTPIPFTPEILAEAITAFQKNVARPQAEQYNFEQMISLVAIAPKLSQGSYSAVLSRLPGTNPDILGCVLFCLSRFFTEILSFDSSIQSNRNFWYKVNDVERAKAIKKELWALLDQYEVTFVSFNYDGIIEAFLDWWFGEVDKNDLGYKYLVELSHAIPLVMPEHVYSRRDARDFSTLAKVPTVLKPHGSIHFFQLRQELQDLAGGPKLAAVHPRLDIGFNPLTAQRDIPSIQFWEFADPTPLINSSTH